MKGMVATSLVILVAVATGYALSRTPWNDYSEQKKITREAELDMKKAELERAELVRRQTQLETPSGREKIAREAGYRRSNEVPVESIH